MCQPAVHVIHTTALYSKCEYGMQFFSPPAWPASVFFFSPGGTGHSYEIPIFKNLLPFNKKFVKKKCFSKMFPVPPGGKKIRGPP